MADVLHAAGDPMTGVIEVLDHGHRITYTLDEIMKYHGTRFPGGVAHAFKAMQRAFPVLDPGGRVERREITIDTAFTGPGGRDAFEMVTRAVTDDRYVIDSTLERPERGPTLQRYVFQIGYRGRSVTVTLRDGYVTDEFIALARQDGRTADDEARLTVLKQEMTQRLLAHAADEVYDAEPPVAKS